MNLRYYIAFTATLSFLMELSDEKWKKYLDSKKPRLTPSGYLRDEETIKKEALMLAEYKKWSLA